MSETNIEQSRKLASALDELSVAIETRPRPMPRVALSPMRLPLSREVKRTRVVVAMLAPLLSAVLTGCGPSKATSGKAPQWDPCAAFPESAMQQLGFDYKSRVQSPGIKCAWVNSTTGYAPEVQYQTDSRLDNWKLETDALTKISIGTYAGYRYRFTGVEPQFMCAVLLETENSSVVFKVINQFAGEEDP
ncbi:DUF3558 family protein [Nocardia amikacinitolerans]|nr:DUF3558 family protein [Nocardia amikacinitolerans]